MMKICGLLVIIFGCILLGFGMSMRSKQNAITHLEPQVIQNQGNMAQSIAIGAAEGVIVGGAISSIIGGGAIFIASIACPPVSLPIVGVCTLLGAGVGAAVGTSDKVLMNTISTTEVVSAYSPSEYWTFIILGALLIAIGILIMNYSSKNNQITVNKQ